MFRCALCADRCFRAKKDNGIRCFGLASPKISLPEICLCSSYLDTLHLFSALLSALRTVLLHVLFIAFADLERRLGCRRCRKEPIAAHPRRDLPSVAVPLTLLLRSGHPWQIRARSRRVGADEFVRVAPSFPIRREVRPDRHLLWHWKWLFRYSGKRTAHQRLFATSWWVP